MPAEQADLPDWAYTAEYAKRAGHYADAFRHSVPCACSLEDFVMAFYATPLFRLERLVLRAFARAPSTDEELKALAGGTARRFAVWSVEERRADQILLADDSGRTRSWLAVQPVANGTDLWFGSVVIPVERRGRPVLGPVFQSLESAHRVYSTALLNAAAARVAR